MSWSFLVLVLAVVVVPGADFVVTLRNTISGGRIAGMATAVGVGVASVIQGTLVSVGLGTLIVQSQPVFLTLKWLGVAYLVLLGLQSLRAAWRARYDDPGVATSDSRRWVAGLRQGFLCNITNPKMFVFYLSLLPQFVHPAAPLWQWLGHAWLLPLLGIGWLLLVVGLGAAARGWFTRIRVRRATDTVCGLSLLGFGVRLAYPR